jgi:hypothetical protein
MMQTVTEKAVLGIEAIVSLLMNLEVVVPSQAEELHDREKGDSAGGSMAGRRSESRAVTTRYV